MAGYGNKHCQPTGSSASLAPSADASATVVASFSAWAIKSVGTRSETRAQVQLCLPPHFETCRAVPRSILKTLASHASDVSAQALSKHIAHLFTRDPLVLFEGRIEEVDDDTEVGQILIFLRACRPR